jgi:hypothetical protein
VIHSTFHIESQTGGFLILDPSVIDHKEDGFEMCINVLFDPQGKTCATLDYPGRSWNEIWQFAVAHFHGVPRADQILLTIAHEGIIVIRIQDQPLTVEETDFVRETFEASLRISQDRLLVIDGMQFFDEEDTDDESSPSLPNGTYHLKIHHINRQPSHGQIVGVFGYTQWPAVIIELQPISDEIFQTKTNASQIICFETSDWPTKATHGIHSIATVKQVSSSSAILELHETKNIRSGMAQITLGSGDKLKRDQQVLVRLDEKQGDLWAAKLTRVLGNQ